MAQKSPLRNSPCSTCEGFALAGVTTAVREMLPAGADQLSRLAENSSYELRGCPHCGRLYGYRHHSEYDVTGSWDEHYFWLWPEPCQIVLPELLDASTPADERDHRFAAALAHDDVQVRLSAALVLASEVPSGLSITTALVAAARALADPEFLVGNFCYRAIRCFSKRGSAEAEQVTRALDAADADRLAPSTASILRDEAANWREP